MSKFALFLILCVPVVFVFIKWAYKYSNPYKLYFVMGKKGSGKTSYLCKLALEYTKKGWTIYTNVSDLRVPGVRIINNISELGNYVPEVNSLLLLDEVSLIWDNRHFKEFKDCTKEFFRLQRHYKCIVYLFSQTFDVDKKIRDLSDRMYLCTQFMGRWSLLREIDKKIIITESSPDAESRVSENLSFCGIFSWRFIYIPRYQPYFESFVLPYKELLNFTKVPDDIDFEIIENRRPAVRIKRFARRAANMVNKLIINLLVRMFMAYYYLRDKYFNKDNEVIPEYESLKDFWNRN
ncbi:MAG: zonular occludens toxin domain-containing protein [Oscillospiraceae bacterium]|nr:zonular occludens toxin domain-containing protein [Oscillospiraceae bacterium]